MLDPDYVDPEMVEKKDEGGDGGDDDDEGNEGVDGSSSGPKFG